MMRGTTTIRVISALSLTVIMAMGLTSCTTRPDSGGDFAAQRETVTAFIAALERGDAEQAATYLSDTASFPRQALTNDFYAKAVSRPTDARVTVATEIDDAVAVQLDFRLGDDRRELNLMLDHSNPPRIEQWSGMPTILRSTAGTGRVAVSDDLTIELDAQSTYASLLPARYRIAFTGTASAGRVDGFELDFPVTPGAADAQLPDGVRFAGGALDFVD
ncbi:hypothetical protein [uncultured Microbacterium sp.]|uniref:hypothetical protein n=1 Tax=uncultured Microbacterium sp. TaxID=191216 RepID=UPI0025DB5A3E|nr:hypothetical protein [uncultured Microbacterium sp.]